MNDMKYDEVKRISGVDTRKCMSCGKCTASCPCFKEMDIHPHQFVYYVETGRLDRLLASKSAYMCLSCFACVERCPRMVEPGRLVEAVRLMLVREQGNNYLKPDEIPALLDEDLPQQAIVSAFRKFTK